jgi:hypothetical protein
MRGRGPVPTIARMVRRRAWSSAGALATVALLAAATVARAMPGDPPVVALAPDDGAIVPADPDGIVVRFSCPAYRQFGDGGPFSVFGGWDDYGAEFATTPDRGSDGRLLETNRVALSGALQSNAGGPDECTATMYVAKPLGPPGPQVTPGTYYWQAGRICTGCDGGYEMSAVRSFTVRAPIALKLAAQAKAYGGYPVIVALNATGVPDDARVALELARGGGWRRIGDTTVFRARAETVVMLPRGRQRLRAHAIVGDQDATSQSQTITVAPARGWRTSHRDDGRYRGRSDASPVALRVARGGREVRAFQTHVQTLCIGPTVAQNHFIIGLAPVARAKVAPDGRFYALAHHGRETIVELRGRLRNGRVTAGRVELTIGGCNGSADFTARRSGTST